MADQQDQAAPQKQQGDGATAPAAGSPPSPAGASPAAAAAPSASSGQGKPDESPAKKTGRTVFILAVVLLLILGAAFWYWRSTFKESTDDAQVDGDIYQISARISGQVVHVYAEDNQKVEKGQLLVEIDPKDQQVALEQAQAALTQAQAQVSSSQADYVQATVNVPITSTSTRTTLQNSGTDVRSSGSSVTQAQQSAAAAAQRVEEAKANAIKATKDVERYTPLVEKDVISRQQYDAAVASATSSNASVLEAENNLVAQQAMITQAQQRLEQSRNQERANAENGPKQVQEQRARADASRAQIAQSMANVKQAQARVDQALLNLSYTRVVSPTAGIVNKKNVEVGANLASGQDLLTIVPLDDLWVTANFKETQLKEMHRCQMVDLEVDALGGRHFSGKVTQIGGATGSRLSLFPPENATGNYVKVVQRIPVRIDFTNLKQENGDYRLRPGFSVTPDVHIKGTGDDPDKGDCEKGLPEHS